LVLPKKLIDALKQREANDIKIKKMLEAISIKGKPQTTLIKANMDRLSNWNDKEPRRLDKLAKTN